jgi:hypothetical protein
MPVLDAPLIGGKPMTDWSQLIEASKKERNLIIKISGFHEERMGRSQCHSGQRLISC